ncbi:MAG: hypothetical protein ACO2Z9_08260 [Crocinitomicaceae bacterium]
MEREERVIAGVALIQVMYAVFMFLSDGAFIFATPLNSILFGVTAIYFGALQFKAQRWSIYFLFLGVVSVLSSPLFLEVLLSGEQLTYFFSTALPDLIAFTFFVMILLFAGIATLKQNNIIARILMIAFIISYVGLQATNNVHLLAFPFLLSLISSQLDKQLKPFHLLWILLFIFELMGAVNQILY